MKNAADRKQQDRHIISFLSRLSDPSKTRALGTCLGYAASLEYYRDLTVPRTLLAEQLKLESALSWNASRLHKPYVPSFEFALTCHILL